MKIRKLFAVLVFMLAAFAATTVSAESLKVYPDYPEEIPVNTDYSITVSQGSVEKPLKVYSACRQTGAMTQDNYRRFAEFEFSGNVKIKIKSDKFDLSKSQIMPKEVANKASISNGEIVIDLDKNCNFAVNVNKDYRTALAVFAEAPETDIPDKDDANVLYYEAGFHDTDDILTLTEGQTLYLAPGSVLNANIKIKGSNVTVRGRGVLRDKIYDASQKVYTMFILNKCSNVNVEGIKILDGNWYAIVGNQDNKDVTIDNVKIMSNKQNTDAISFWGGSTNLEVKNCYILNGDNVFVFKNKQENLSIHDCIVGSYGALIAFSTVMEGDAKVSDMSVFATDLMNTANMALIVNNVYSNEAKSGQSYRVDKLTVENIDASYCKNVPQLFAGKGFGDDEKIYIFKNIILPGTTKGIRILAGGNYNITMNDVWYGSTLVKSEQDARITDLGDKTSKFTYNRESTDMKVFINGYMVKFDAEPVIENDRTLVPIRAISAALGADVDWNNETKAVGIKVGDKKIELVIGSNNAVVDGENKTLDVAAKIMEGRTYVPLRFIGEAFGADVDYIAETKTVDITSSVFGVFEEKKEATNQKELGTELLTNADFETDLTKAGDYESVWEAHNDAMLSIVKDPQGAQNGNSYCKISDRKHSYSGIRQVVKEQLEENGPGTYKIRVWVRAKDNYSALIGKTFHMTLAVQSENDVDQQRFSKHFKMTSEWQEIENTVEVKWDGALQMARLVMCGVDEPLDEVYIDNCSMVKVK